LQHCSVYSSKGNEFGGIVETLNASNLSDDDGPGRFADTRNGCDGRSQVRHDGFDLGFRVFHLRLNVLDLLNQHTQLKREAVAAEGHTERLRGGGRQLLSYLKAQFLPAQRGQ